MPRINITELSFEQVKHYHQRPATMYVRDGVTFVYCGDDRLDITGEVTPDTAALLDNEYPRIAAERSRQQWPKENHQTHGALSVTNESTPGLFTLGFVYPIQYGQSAYVLHCGVTP